MREPAGVRPCVTQRLDDGVQVVRVGVVVHVVIEILDVSELIESDGLRIETAIGDGGESFAPAKRPPVEDVVLGAETHLETRGCTGPIRTGDASRRTASRFAIRDGACSTG